MVEAAEQMMSMTAFRDAEVAFQYILDFCPKKLLLGEHEDIHFKIVSNLAKCLILRAKTAIAIELFHDCDMDLAQSFKFFFRFFLLWKWAMSKSFFI